jgi:ATP-dependent Clp protease protease subunit
MKLTLLLLLPLLLLGTTATALENAQGKPPKKDTAVAPAPKASPKPRKQPNPERKPTAPKDNLEELQKETALLQAKRERITAEIELEQAELDRQLAKQKRELTQLKTEIDAIKTRMELKEIERKASEDPELTELKAASERLLLEASIAKNNADIEGYEIRHEENAIRRQTSALTLGMELQEKQEQARAYAVNKEPAYLKNPYKDGKLIISDRRIPLNGVVTSKTADDIAERIHYFNNRDVEAPIFLVIDDCPGGSVMAGYKILKAMHGSNAPVYVVVKSFAASLAACLTTCAERSFAYPNAIIMHHQLAVISGGNLTQHREMVSELEKWWVRLATPIADKMGITLEEFIQRMYDESSTGDWNEFADDAKKLGWVDVIVEDIQETSLLRHPDMIKPRTTSTRTVTTGSPGLDGTWAEAHHEIVLGEDDRGRPVALLPRLNPLDAYWLYNPDGYYQLR